MYLLTHGQSQGQTRPKYADISNAATALLQPWLNHISTLAGFAFSNGKKHCGIPDAPT